MLSDLTDQFFGFQNVDSGPGVDCGQSKGLIVYTHTRTLKH